jgi:Phage Tail Collar Domain
MSHRTARWLGVVSAVTLFAGAFAGVSAASSAPSSQAFTGCLEFGFIFNVALGSSPTHSCPRSATQITWNQSSPQSGTVGSGAPGPKGSTGAVGPQGPKGSTGAVGPQGPKGTAGAVGPQGPKGTTGSAGSMGPKGITGSAGPQGPKGSTGSTGPQGPKGNTGSAGPQGPQGSTGERGLPGPTGATGPAGPPGTSAFGTDTQSAAYGYGTGCTLGEVILSAGSIANGLPANGQVLPISQFPALFALLGTQFGGDGTTGFALPNLNAAAPNGLTYSICINGVSPSKI